MRTEKNKDYCCDVCDEEIEGYLFRVKVCWRQFDITGPSNQQGKVMTEEKGACNKCISGEIKRSLIEQRGIRNGD